MRGNHLSPVLLRTDAGRAACALLWSEGITQRAIASAFGLKTGYAVCWAIDKFLHRYTPEYYTAEAYGMHDRQHLAGVAAERYIAARREAP